MQLDKKNTIKSIMLFLSCLCYAFGRVGLLMPCGHLLGKAADLLALVCDV